MSLFLLFNRNFTLVLSYVFKNFELIFAGKHVFLFNFQNMTGYAQLHAKIPDKL